MELPFYILLIIYLAGVGAYLLWSFFNFYHLVKFGMFDFTGKLNAFLFIGFSIAIISVTFLLLFDTPWFDTFNLFNITSDVMSLPGGSESSNII